MCYASSLSVSLTFVLLLLYFVYVRAVDSLRWDVAFLWDGGGVPLCYCFAGALYCGGVEKLLAPVVMVAWALPPVLAVSMKRWSEMSGQPPEAWQWCVSAVGIGVLWCVSVWLCRALLCFSWRRSICVSLAIFAIYTVMLLGICPGKPLDASQTEVQYHE